MFLFTGIKEAGCGKPQHSSAKAVMVATSKNKKKMEKGAFLGKAVAKVKKSLGIGKKTRSMLSPQKLLEAQKKDPALGRN